MSFFNIQFYLLKKQKKKAFISNQIYKQINQSCLIVRLDTYNFCFILIFTLNTQISIQFFIRANENKN